MQYMIPLIINSADPDKQEVFVNDFIQKNQIRPYYVFRIGPVKTEISIDQIRAIRKEIIMAIPEKRLFVVYKFDTASIEAQNALLKTLEERNESNQYILLTEDIGRVLPTIQSRSKTINLDDATPAIINESVQKLIEAIDGQSNYSFLVPVTSISREDAIKFFDHSIVVLRSMLTSGKKSIPVILKSAVKQRSLLLNNNLNHQLAIDSFLLFINKTVSK